MKKISLYLSFLCLVVLFTGCPKTAPKQPVSFKRITDGQGDFLKKFDNELTRYDCLMQGRKWVEAMNTFQDSGKSRNRSTSTSSSCAGDFAVPTSDQKSQARILRNDIANQLIRFTDYNYFQFENDLYVRRASGSVLADLVDTGANFAATITNGERAKTIINAAIIAFRGSRKSVSLNFFREQTGEILITKMQTSRNRVLKELIVQLRDKDVDQYPLDAALGDVIRYFYAGTLPRALQELQQDTSVAAQQAQQDILILKDVPIGTVATQTQRDLAVLARSTLKKLSDSLNNSSLSVRTASLATLQSIAEKIKADTTITDEMNKDAILKTLLSKLTTDINDGVKLAQDIQDIREEGFSNGTLKQQTIDKIDKIIANADKN